ncbi:helix-turn-helix domain-containing protein [Chryseobacterium mucoviscidosis]|uniref:helix-turn-helix domain-containing protein n=1 Tax=Chryseobacterium mucoviscidosis TaxID=1945581 RepID=UPI0025EF5E2B|nr:helix-turn-helix domain-containing protein [uncultured Chryseobacterium sp.]
MEVICLQDAALYALIDQVLAQLRAEHNKTENKWLNTDEAMQLLNIKSKTTLQNLRDEGKIRYSQPQKKIILYDRDSINIYLENNARKTF